MPGERSRRPEPNRDSGRHGSGVHGQGPRGNGDAGHGPASGQLSASIQHWRAGGQGGDLAALSRQARDAALLSRVSQALAESRLDVAETMTAIARHLVAEFADLCVVGRLLHEDGVVATVAVESTDETLRRDAAAAWPTRYTPDPSLGLTARAVATRRPVRVGGSPQELAAASHALLRPLFLAHGLHSALVVPMHADNNVMGTLALVRGSGRAGFDEQDEHLAQDLADRTGLAVANALLHEALRTSERRFRAAFDDAPVGMAIASVDPAHPGRYLEVNDALCALTGYPREQLVGMSFRELTHPDDRGPDEPLTRDLVAGASGSYYREKRLLRADGRTIWVRTSASVLATGPGGYAIGHMLDITASKAAEEDLAYRALHDDLTGLGNRPLVMDRLALALRQLERSPGAVAVLYLDLDGFKDVNDRLGHAAGDAVLREAAARLARAVRTQDTPGRLGGDEFAVVCPDAAEQDAHALATRVAATIAGPVAVRDRTVHLSTSIGVSVTRDPGSDPGTLLGRADQAMYQAKRRGPGRVHLYRPRAEGGDHQDLVTEATVRAALDEDRLRLHYQPIIDLSDGRVVAAEALLRIEHPGGGLLLPREFMSVAETTALIEPMQDWAIAHACAQLTAWSTVADMSVSINLSAATLADPGLLDRVRTALQRTGSQPDRICVELPEQALLAAGQATLDGLQALARCGVHVAVDRFGAHGANPALLRHLPVDTLKIDQSLVAGARPGSLEHTAIAAITALAEARSLTVVACGVENAAQLGLLRRLDCHRAQGLHIAPPSPAETVTGLLARPARLPHAAHQHHTGTTDQSK